MERFLAILLICQILTLSISDSVIEKVDRDSTEVAQNIGNLNRRKLPIFPKNSIKFVVTPKPPTNVAYNHKPKDKIMSKIALSPPIKLEPGADFFPITVTTRKPLMKLRTFTLKSPTDEINGIIKNPDADARVINKSKIRTDTNAKTVSTKKRENVVVEDGTSEEYNIDFKNLLTYSEVPNNQLKKQNGRKSDQIHNEFLVAEEQDRNEFIFLDDNQDNIVNRLDSGQEFDEGLDTTTDLQIIEKEDRVKRSKNIIEEETLSSTVSGFKYTGHNTRLDNNFYFKNINS